MRKFKAEFSSSVGGYRVAVDRVYRIVTRSESGSYSSQSRSSEQDCERVPCLYSGSREPIKDGPGSLLLSRHSPTTHPQLTWHSLGSSPCSPGYSPSSPRCSPSSLRCFFIAPWYPRIA